MCVFVIIILLEHLTVSNLQLSKLLIWDDLEEGGSRPYSLFHPICAMYKYHK